MGMDDSVEHVMKENMNVNLENIIILKRYEPVISPFGDVMRDILLAVYQENVEEIVVSTVQNNTNPEINMEKLYQNKELQDKIRTLDYLFQNSKPEFQEGSIKEWLEGRNPSTENCVNVIRQHPLMPRDVIIRELSIEKQKELSIR